MMGDHNPQRKKGGSTPQKNDQSTNGVGAFNGSLVSARLSAQKKL
jgi:hypothetical protein